LQDNAKKQLGLLLEELAKSVEELLMAGLTAASKSTVERLDVSFKEASRMKLLRLGSTLRIANEEIARFTAGSANFSARRLAFFLGRAWLLASAMRRAIDENDQEGLERLMAIPVAEPVEKLSVVTLGVSKRVVPGAFASFEFRLRSLADTGSLAKGTPLIWSCVFPLRKDLDLPTEAFLHLPQKQKFKPSLLLEKKTIEITKCAVAKQSGGAARLSLSDASTLTEGNVFEDWASFWQWDPRAAAERLETHRPTPMDLEIELQEEVFLADWDPGERRETEEGFDLLPIESRALTFEARLDRGPSGIPLRARLSKLSERKIRPSLYGVVHYESCRLIFQPLSALEKNEIEYLTVSQDKINQAELVRAMKFT
jgi:hypothetical protein